jgi:hypothetical protein
MIENYNQKYLEITVTDGEKYHTVITNIEVPHIRDTYYINIGGEQVKVTLLGFTIQQSICNTIMILARVVDEEKSTYGQRPNIVMYDVLIKDLFKTKDKAYNYYLRNRETPNSFGNASLIEV